MSAFFLVSSRWEIISWCWLVGSLKRGKFKLKNSTNFREAKTNLYVCSRFPDPT